MKNATYIYHDELFFESVVKHLGMYAIARNIFFKSLVPLLNIKNKEKKLYESIGTALYVQFNEHKYLITARHVADFHYCGNNRNTEVKGIPQIPLNKNYLGNIPCIQNLKGKFICTKSCDTDIDIAFYPLASDLERFTPIKIDVELPKLSKTSFLCMGYPSTRFKNEINSCKSQLVNFIGPKGKINPIPKELLNQCFGSVNFIKDKCFDANKNNTQFPKPNGMSGGVAIGFNQEMNNFCLAGIITQYEPDRTRNQVLTYTRIENIQRMLTDAENRYCYR